MNLLGAHDPAVFFVNGLGDCVINMPALRAITRLFCGRATLICEEGDHSQLFDELCVKKRVHIKTAREASNRWVPSGQILQEIPACDLFISLVPWISDSLRAVIKKHRSVGFFRDYSIQIPLDFEKHSVDLAFDVAKLIDSHCKLEDYTTPIRFPNRAVAWVQEIQKLLPPGSRILTVHPDSLKEKMWNLERLRTSIEVFLKRRSDYFVFVLGYQLLPFDRGLLNERIIPSQRIGFILSSCLVAHSDLFLGIDSCYMHVADLARVPGVALFGPTNAREFGFRLGPNITIQGQRTLDEISTETVIAALESIVDNPVQSATWTV